MKNLCQFIAIEQGCSYLYRGGGGGGGGGGAEKGSAERVSHYAREKLELSEWAGQN